MLKLGVLKSKVKKKRDKCAIKAHQLYCNSASYFLTTEVVRSST